MKHEIAELTSDLIKFESVKERPDELKRIIDFIENYFAGLDVSIIRTVVDDKHSLIVLPKGISRPRICLASHADVIEAEAEQFSPRIDGDKLFGRGSIDMKAGLAISMLLFKRHYKEGKLGLIITTDEEIGGFKGAGILAETFSAELFIASEPTSLGITIKEKGILWAKLVATGKSCHGSRPWLGKNAADELIKAYLKIKQLFPDVTEDSWKTTMNLGILKSGVAPNVVPDLAEMTLDFRHTEDMPSDRIVRMVNDAIKEFDVKFEILEQEPMLVNSKITSEMKLFEKAYVEVLKAGPKYIWEHGASDLRFFSENKDACILFGPHGENYHGKGEYVELDSCEKCYRVLDEFLKHC